MMKHTYKITGMTCGSCKQKITNTLKSIAKITQVKIDQEKGLAKITMSSHVQTSAIQSALMGLGDYSISIATQTLTKQSQNKNHLKDLLPLFVIVGSILLFSILTTLITKNGLFFGMRMFMAGFFIIFGILKALKLRSFAIAYKEYDIVAKNSNAYAYAYPFIEIALGFLYFTNLVPLVTNSIAIFIMSIGAIGVYTKLRKKEQIPCACLGMVFKVPMTWVTLVEDLLMLVMAMIMLVLR